MPTDHTLTTPADVEAHTIVHTCGPDCSAPADHDVPLPINAYAGFVPRPSASPRKDLVEPVLMPEPGRPSRLIMAWRPVELTASQRLEVIRDELIAALEDLAAGDARRPRVLAALTEVEAAASLTA